MWPVRSKSRAADVVAALDEAVPYAAEKWPQFWPGHGSIELAEAIGEFLEAIQTLLQKKFFLLRRAPDDLFLIVVVKAIETSGTHSRQEIEEALGVTLPE